MPGGWGTICRLRSGAVVSLASLALLACTRTTEGSPGVATPAPAVTGAPAQSEGPKTVRVGNQVGGVLDQPDYDAQAEVLRADVDPELPRPLPSAELACRGMLDAVETYYEQTEGIDSKVVANLRQTRERDFQACVTRTSAAAASCVSVVIRDGSTSLEFPQALDLCTRAYP